MSRNGEDYVSETSSEDSDDDVDIKHHRKGYKKRSSEFFGDMDDDIALEDDYLIHSQSDTEEQSIQTMREAGKDTKIPTYVSDDTKNIVEDVVFDLDSSENVVKMETLRENISKIVFILSNIKKVSNRKISRKEYVSCLLKYLSMYYGYSSYMINMLFGLFPISELIEFLEVCESQRPLTIRANSLKIKRRDLAHLLINKGVDLDPLSKWSSVGLQIIESPIPIGATPEYLSGYYAIQSAASFLPVMALDPKPEETVLDMCSAPGGKSTYIAALMKNTGCLYVNDISKERMKATCANMSRMGVTNAIALSVDGRDLGKYMYGVDRILLDAPCSGTGIVSKDTKIKVSKDQSDFDMLSRTQKELIITAANILENKFDEKTGYLVYSTCSISIEENEAVIDYLLKEKPNFELVDTGLPFGNNGFLSFKDKRFHPSMKLARRFYPHTHNVDGFFVAKLKQIRKPKTNSKVTHKSKVATERKKNGRKEEKSGEIRINKKRKFNTSETSPLDHRKRKPSKKSREETSL